MWWKVNPLPLPLIFSFNLYIFTTFSATSNTKPLTITILHTNDIHARYLETDSYGLRCSKEEIKQHKCYGGFSRLHYIVGEIRKSHPNLLYLSAGDYFQGTPWYRVYKWKLLARYLNKFNHTAMTLGNHEFDDGVKALTKFLDLLNFPVLASNIDITGESGITGKFEKSIIVEIENRKIGIIGYTKKDTAELSNVGKLLFEDEISAVAKEADKLNKMGVKIIIALGHSGYQKDLEVARVPFVDVVVGGHSNTFLYSGPTPPDIEKPAGEYPTIIRSKVRNVPVVQAYAFGKYLGYLNVTFDEEGEVRSWAGNPILLDTKIPQDRKMEAELTKLGKVFLKSANIRIGKSTFFLDGLATCRMRECAMGDVLADAMVEKLNTQNRTKNLNVTIGMITGGMSRASIPANRSITLEDALTVFPFTDEIVVVTMKGSHLRNLFELSVADYDQSGMRHTGRFLQISGIRVIYDFRKAVGMRVVKMDTLIENTKRIYIPVRDNILYRIATSSYLANGGDGLKIIKQNKIRQFQSGLKVIDALTQYLKHHNPLTEIVGNRTQLILDKEKAAWAEL